MNKELSTGLYPVKEPTAEEMQARRASDKEMKTHFSDSAIAERVKAVTAEADNLRNLREQRLEGIPQSPEIQNYINRTYERESAELFRQLSRAPEESA
jgi:hypothetical protein